jgi:hypothetical protein
MAASLLPPHGSAQACNMCFLVDSAPSGRACPPILRLTLVATDPCGGCSKTALCLQGLRIAQSQAAHVPPTSLCRRARAGAHQRLGCRRHSKQRTAPLIRNRPSASAPQLSSPGQPVQPRPQRLPDQEARCDSSGATNKQGGMHSPPRNSKAQRSRAAPPWSPERAGRAPPRVTPLRAREAPLRLHRPPRLLCCAPYFPLPLLHVRSPLGRVNTRQHAKLARDHVRALSSICVQNATTAFTEQPHCRPSQLFPSDNPRLAAAAPRQGTPCPAERAPCSALPDRLGDGTSPPCHSHPPRTSCSSRRPGPRATACSRDAHEQRVALDRPRRRAARAHHAVQLVRPASPCGLPREGKGALRLAAARVANLHDDVHLPARARVGCRRL